MTTVNNKIITKTSTFPCSIDTAWWKWTTHEGLLTFLGQDNKVELQLGGAYEIYFLMNNPIGKRGGEGNNIISYLPKEMLSFTWNAPPQYSIVRNHEHQTWVVLNFSPMNEHTTQITLKHLGWLDGDEWGAVYQYFDSAWETVFSWFEKSCS